MTAAPASVRFFSLDLASAPDTLSTRFPDLYSPLGNGTEKAIEHGLTFFVLDPGKVRRHCDIAASASPFAAVCAAVHPTIEFWQQDLAYDSNRSERKIGGFAQEMREVPDGFFDSLSLHCSFEHFEGRADSAFLSEVNRVLSERGACFIAPLYLDLEPKIFFDPTVTPRERLSHFDDEAVLCATRHYRQEHGRYYSPATLRTRLLDALPADLQASLIRFRNPPEDVYLRFGLVLHRTNSIFAAQGLTLESQSFARA